ncbi:kinesin 1 [Euphorbia peplus]|nr:kinesin 1 [Euphorbia peplus]
MASRDQNRAPRPNPSAKDRAGGGAKDGVEKKRKVGGTNTDRKPLIPVNKRADAQSSSDAGSMDGSEIQTIDFTKEQVESLVNERVKMTQYEQKRHLEVITLIKRLKVCIKWFQRKDEAHLDEQARLRNALECSERTCTQKEAEMRDQEEKLNATISELRNVNSSLQEKLREEEAEKLDAIDRYTRERDARIAVETEKASVTKDLEKAQQDIVAANKRATSLEDMYKRLHEYNQSLQQYNTKLQTEDETSRESLKRVEREKATILENLSSLRGHCTSLQEQLTFSRDSQDEALNQKNILAGEVKCLRGELQQVREDRDRQTGQVQALSAEVAKYKESTGKSFAEIDSLVAKSKSLEETCSSQREQIHLLEHQLTAAREKLKMVDMSASEARIEFEQKQKTIQELQERLADAELQLLEGEKLRKKLHNTILELKGNIRVFCRVRPVLPDDGVGSEAQAILSYPSSVENLGRGIELIQNGQKYPFTFDKVFSHDAGQQDVFVEISQLVQSALDGYKVCIFAYGQTGSGKTYTMMGKPDAPDQKGLIPRSLEQIFQISQSLSAQGWKYKMQASMLEIYNENIRDLLSTNKSNCPENAGKQYTITHDTNGNTDVSGLTIVDVCSIREISSLLKQAAQSRSVGKTQMNEQSSRSHFVFTLRISGVNENTEQQVQGVLNLIDLAGSERLSRSGATGDRLKETQAINKSLSSLSDVIFGLAKKEPHVPFRNSKLTYLLQPCLGGDSKTLMFVNIAPDPSSVGESLCSLRFAARVNACEIGIPRRQTAAQASGLTDSRLSYG